MFFGRLIQFMCRGMRIGQTLFIESDVFRVRSCRNFLLPEPKQLDWFLCLFSYELVVRVI